MFSNLFNLLKDNTSTNNNNNNDLNNSNNDYNNNFYNHMNNNLNKEIVKHNTNNNNNNNEKIGGILSLMKNITNDTLDGKNLNSIHNNLGIKCDELVIEIHKQQQSQSLPTNVNNTYNTYNNYGTNNYSNNYNLNGGNSKSKHNRVNRNKTNSKGMIKNDNEKHNCNKHKHNGNHNQKHYQKHYHNHRTKSSTLKKSNKKLSTYNKDKKTIILDLFNKCKNDIETRNENENSIIDIKNIMNSNISNKVNNEKKNVKLYLVNEENVCITIPKIYLDDLYNPLKDILLKCVVYSICSKNINIHTDTTDTVINTFIKDKENYLDNIQSNLQDIKFEIYNKILYNKVLTIQEKKKAIIKFNCNY
jgi:hypothetical protein